ncbi:alpha/beta hydrolase [Cupriavidus sp. USMAA2-4]|uniref:alpha/beta fold hydrolase n=1 Tax=Cupriavidus sp. USMAA2-4 TaxID=876364 RepID=UPI0008A6ED87|nr:alpha/beta hydrolase [Cupriavidus sp. USMAA2-4]AOY93197.1 alpha/beta hydrolase [Cupriavidus sp. USMAA2-4]
MSPAPSTPAGAPARRLHANGIATLEQGEGTVTVVLLHGIGGGKAAWPEQLAALARAGYRALAWDMPGYGDSALIDPYDFDGLAAALAPLLQAERAAGRRVVLLGHSMGGMVAQQACAATPALIDGMVLSGTSPAFGKPGGDWQRDFVAARTAPLDAGRSMAEMAAGLVRAMVAPDAPPDGVAFATAVMAAVPPATYRAALGALVRFDQREALARIAVPVLALAGEHDNNAAPAVMERMAQRIAGAEYHCLPGVGHLACMEQPALFNAAVLDFLARRFPPA